MRRRRSAPVPLCTQVRRRFVEADLASAAPTGAGEDLVDSWPLGQLVECRQEVLLQRHASLGRAAAEHGVRLVWEVANLEGLHSCKLHAVHAICNQQRHEGECTCCSHAPGHHPPAVTPRGTESAIDAHHILRPRRMRARPRFRCRQQPWPPAGPRLRLVTSTKAPGRPTARALRRVRLLSELTFAQPLAITRGNERAAAASIRAAEDVSQGADERLGLVESDGMAGVRNADRARMR